MKNCVLEEIKLISSLEKSGASFTFDAGLNVITGQNGVGKSHLIKSIPWVFGAEPATMHPNWVKADISVILRFKIKDKSYKILRSGKTFLIFDDKNNLLHRSSQSVTKELSPFLSELFGFHLELPIKDTSDLAQLPPAFFLLPFYVDQDSGWTNLWQSFKNLQMFANWRKPLLDNFTGILSLELQSVKNDLRNARLSLKNLEKQRDLFAETFEGVRAEISNSDFDVDIDEYKNEIDELVARLSDLQKIEFEYKESIRSYSNRKSVLQNQINVVKASVKSLDKDQKIGDSFTEEVVECPTCGTEHQNSFVEKFSIAQDLYRAQELQVDLEEDFNKTEKELKKMQEMDIKNTEEIERLNDILNKKGYKLTINEVIKKEGEKHLRTFLRLKAGELSEKYDAVKLTIAALEKRNRELTKDVKDQKTRVEDYFVKSMTGAIFFLHVKNLKLDDYKDMYAGNLPESGSDKPRAFLAHVFSVIKTVEQFYNGVTPPIIIDSPNQQDQDPSNMDKIYNFIVNEKPKNNQMILGLANGEDRDFGDCKKIILKNEGQMLENEKYADIQKEFTELYSIGLL